ncbi:M23 family metallopeptidase [Streptomyces aurantiogriseus]|uniref:Peptidase n=1 Tax=Streptomyces aurantiogriseus TaxID=66870 RepID=A0A918C0D9_9ACTN|nr:M23 family metallopeptidase [Streptomyces aurantiogriseus]GGQ98623.1 peptidase [Streptomyces aurantiogriseus]
MPAKGKHRRPKTQRFTRSIAAAGTGGAALALPLIGATGAHAAPAQSAPAQSVSSVSEKAVEAAPVAQKSAAESKSAASATTYTVRAGDYLSKIANEQHVSGGWQRLYEDNREVVGDDPSLIHPGLKLSIGKKATAGATKSPSTSAGSSSSSKSSKSSKSSGSSKSSASKSSSDSSASKTSTTQAAERSSNAGGYSQPVAGATVGTPYRMSGSMWSSGYHTGVDFSVPTGTSLKAVGAGTVVSAGWGGAYGNQVVIKLADGYYAQYAHLSQLSVSAGQTVSAGQQVGLSGATGNVTGPHLHFEIRATPNYGSDIDPVAYLRTHGVSVG